MRAWKEMAVRRVGVRKGKTRAIVLGAVLLASACSSDSLVSFDPLPNLSDTSGSGGTSSAAGKSSGFGGTEGRAGSDATSGSSAEAGSSSGGGSAGSDAGGSPNEGGAESGGSASEGIAGRGGSETGGTRASAGSSAEGGKGGAATGGGGAAGMAGQGGSGGGSNGGLCTTGVFGTHTYAFCGVVANAAAAAAKCENLGLEMVSIESKLENDYVLAKQSSTWLGGTDEAMEGEWRWTATKAVFWREKSVLGVYNNFVDGQPNNKDNQGNPENCLALDTSGWNDVGCDLGDFKATCESGGGPIGPPWPPF